MSFFIKAKRGYDNTIKNNHFEKKEPQKKTFTNEISSESEYEDSGLERASSEDENETSQEKRLRLAKLYLQELENAEKGHVEEESHNSIIPNGVISNRLREDYLKQTGRFRSTVADQYTGYDQEQLLLLKCKDCKRPVTCLCVSYDNKYFFSGSKDGTVVKWSISDKRKVKSIPYKKKHSVQTENKIDGHSSTINCIAITDDFKFLAVGEENNFIQIWNPDTLEHIKTLKGHKNHVMGLVFRKNTHMLYSCSKDKCVKIWSLDEMSYLESLFGHQDIVQSIDTLARERVITAGGLDGTLRIWKIAEESQLIFTGTEIIDCVKLINEDNFVSAGDSGMINVWSAGKKKPVCTVRNAHGVDVKNNKANWICSVATLVNTDLIATGSNDGHIRLWKTEHSFASLKSVFTIPVAGFVNSLAFTSDGNYLIAGVGQEHRLGRWQVLKHSKNGVFVIRLLKNS